MTTMSPSRYDFVALTGLVLLTAIALAIDSLWITAYACLFLGPRAAWVLWGMLQAQGHDVVLTDRVGVLALPFRFGFWGVMCTHGYVLICSILLMADLIAWSNQHLQ